MPSIGEGGTAADGASNTGNAIKTTPGIIRDGGSMAGSSTSTDNARTGSGCQKQDETLEEKLERARRIAAERVEAEKAKAKAEEVEAKANAFVDGIYQAAVAKAAIAVTGSSPSSNSSSTSTAVTTTTRLGIGRDDGGSTSMDTARTGLGGQQDQLELAWRIAAERVQAETEEAKAIVDGYVQAAIANVMCCNWQVHEYLRRTIVATLAT